MREATCSVEIETGEGTRMQTSDGPDSRANGVAERISSIVRSLRPGLDLLLRAQRYAEELSCGPWDFAVEISSLRSAGMSNSDLRWLVCKGYAEHSEEVRVAGQAGRQFRRIGGLSFTKRTSFILTEDGLRLVIANSASHDSDAQPHAACEPVKPAENGEALRPQWDPGRQEFRAAGKLVKEFKLPSPNQEMILMVFEEEGWPPRIDDPLPPHKHMDSKRRLHDTIKSLNRNQKHRLIRFMGDGTGRGVRWHFIA